MATQIEICPYCNEWTTTRARQAFVGGKAHIVEFCGRCGRPLRARRVGIAGWQIALVVAILLVLIGAGYLATKQPVVVKPVPTSMPPIVQPLVPPAFQPQVTPLPLSDKSRNRNTRP